MPPTDTTPQSQIRYFKRIIAALVVQANGELRIPQKFMRQVASESSPQGLFEDTNTDSDELVLRFGTKNSAVYTVEPEPCASPTLRSPTSVSPQSYPPNDDPSPPRNTMGRPPLTEQQLAVMEMKVKRARAAARMRSGREPANSSETSELNFPV